MTVQRDVFTSWHEEPVGVRVGGRRVLSSPGRGDIEVLVNGAKCTLKDVLYVPELGYNLVSISALEKSGCTVEFGQGRVKVWKNGTCLATGVRSKKLYLLSGTLPDSALVAQSEIAFRSGLNESTETPDFEEAGSTGSVSNSKMSEAVIEDLPENNNQETHTAIDAYTKLHRRLGHPGKGRMAKLSKSVYGIPEKQVEPQNFFCDVCENNKLTRHVRKFRYEKETHRGGRLFMDVWGKYNIKTEIPGIGKLSYYSSVVDEATGMSWINVLPNRKKVAEFSLRTTNMIDREDAKVKYVRCDNAKEFQKIEGDLSSKGINVEWTTTYTPEQNGVAERLNRTLVTMVRCMLQEADLPDGFWPYAAQYACYLRNRLPMSEACSPFESWNKVKPLLGHEKTFGMLCKTHVPKEKRDKLMPTAEDGIYIGVASETQSFVYLASQKAVVQRTSVKVFEDRKASHLLADIVAETSYTVTPITLKYPYHAHYEGEYDTEDPVVATQQNIVGTENQSRELVQTGDLPINQNPNFSGDSHTNSVPNRPDVVTNGTTPQREISENPPPEKSTSEGVPKGGAIPSDNISQKQTAKVQNNSSETQQNTGTLPAKYQHQNQDQSQNQTDTDTEMGEANETNAHTNNNSSIQNDNEMDTDNDNEQQPVRRSSRTHGAYNPHTFDIQYGLISREVDPLSYKQAINSKFWFRWKEAIDKELISLITRKTWELVPRPKQKCISSKWVFKTKYTPAGLIDKYKARLVAKGFLQKHGIDYEETFAPTLRYESLRILIALCAKHGLTLWLLDVISAYLNGTLDTDIFMEIPEGYPGTEQTEGKVLRLLKGLYGLKQSGRIWSARFREVMEQHKFKPITADSCIFKRVFKNKDVCLIALYVDDIVIATRKSETYKRVKGYITSAFEVTDSGKLTGILGIRVVQDKKRGVITMDQEKYIEELLARYNMSNCRPVSTPIDGYETLQPPRPDEERADQHQYQKLVGELMFLVNATRSDLSFVISKLSQFCTDPTVRHWNGLIRVLRYLRFTISLGICFTADEEGPKNFADAAYADNKEDRRSTCGYVMILAGAACVWYSRKQRSVVTSTTEAEYLALAEGCKAGIWSSRWLQEAGYGDNTSPVVLYGDNNGSLAITKNPENHSRTKHIDIQYHFVREKVAEGLVSIQYVSTKEQIADIMTKPLTKQPFEYLRLKLGLIDVPAP